MHIKIIKNFVKAYPIRKEPEVLATNAGTTTYCYHLYWYQPFKPDPSYNFSSFLTFSLSTYTEMFLSVLSKND